MTPWTLSGWYILSSLSWPASLQDPTARSRPITMFSTNRQRIRLALASAVGRVFAEAIALFISAANASCMAGRFRISENPFRVHARYEQHFGWYPFRCRYAAQIQPWLLGRLRP